MIKTLCVSSIALLFSASALAGGGGGGGGGNTGGLPAPNTCENNCGFELGPNPSANFLSASRGPLPTSTTRVSSGQAPGFGGGTVYYPTNVSSEMGTIAIAPGFTARQGAVAWWGQILASHGFVAMTIDTNSRFDQPASRGRQLDSALSYLIAESKKTNSPLFGLVDETRLGTMGHSMGGGGSLHSASRNRLSAAIPLAPWNSGGNSFGRIRVPTMIMACENDGTASVNRHARPFYNTIPNSTDKVYLEINNGDHGCSTGRAGTNRALQSTYGVSWMKRFLDKDRRYDRFLCGPDHRSNRAISDFRDTCTF